jgi:hypothetical protein
MCGTKVPQIHHIANNQLTGVFYVFFSLKVRPESGFSHSQKMVFRAMNYNIVPQEEASACFG